MHHRLSNLTLPILGSLEAIRVALVIVQSLDDFLLGAEDKGAVLHNWLIERCSGDEGQAGGLVGTGVDFKVDDIAGLLKDDVVVLLHGTLLVLFADEHVALEGIRKGVPVLGQGLDDLAAGADGDVEDPDGRVGEVLDRVDAVALARDDLDGDAVVVDVDGGDLGGAQVAVPRLARLEVRRQVHPQLEPDVGAAVGVLARHLGVHDAPPGRHELQVSRRQGAAVAGKVFVVDAALEEVRDCFLTTVRAANMLASKMFSRSDKSQTH